MHVGRLQGPIARLQDVPGRLFGQSLHLFWAVGRLFVSIAHLREAIGRLRGSIARLFWSIARLRDCSPRLLGSIARLLDPVGRSDAIKQPSSGMREFGWEWLQPIPRHKRARERPRGWSRRLGVRAAQQQEAAQSADESLLSLRDPDAKPSGPPAIRRVSYLVLPAGTGQ